MTRFFLLIKNLQPIVPINSYLYVLFAITHHMMNAQRRQTSINF